MERFRLCLLGPFQALLDGKPITGFESNKTRALLAYLAVENSRPHSREVLAELLWPERPQGIALANLRHTLAGLRTAIGDHTAAQRCLLVAHQTLQFDPASLASGEAVVDTCRFGELLADVRGASRTACAEAAALYRGQFLQGFTLHNSAEFEAWLVLQRERCDHLAAQALARLVQYGAEQGDYAQGTHWAQRLLEIDPWNEDVHRQLMWLLAACGERAAALRQYDACVRLLAAEFGTEPQPATLILADCIHAGETDLGPFPGGSPDGGPNGSSGVERLRGAGGGDARAAGGDVHNLPLAATPLVGRTRELEEIAQTLAAPGCRLLTITGPGGIGKTRLAMETTQRVAPCFRDGAWFVDLATAGEATVLPSVLLKRLDALESGPAEARARLMAHLATKHMLLVLDNFEHLLDGADLVADMAAAAPALQILVTSRVRLNLREEWLHPLNGMELPSISGAAPLEHRADPPDGQAQFEHGPRASADLPVDLGAYDATRLFLACVRRLQPGFTPSREETQTIAAICCGLEGMPLAIELAASWIRSMPLRALAAEVENGLLRLETPLRNVPPRHRSMAAVFDQSWRLLTERERAILRGLSVFHGGATPEAAGAVTGAEPADLSRLIDASWLRLGRDGRYVSHELVRQYCAACLTAEPAGAAEEFRRRHCAWCGEFVRAQTRRVNYHHDVITALLAEFGNLQAAWQWGVEHGQMEIARDMALGLFYICDMLGWYHFAIQSYAPIIATLAPIIAAPATPAAERSGARVVLYWLEFAQCGHCADLGLVEQAKGAAMRCRVVAGDLEAGNARTELMLLSDRLPLYALVAAGAIDEARQVAERFVGELVSTAADFTLYGNELGRKFWLAHGYADLAHYDWYQANYEAAEALWQRAIALREEMGEQRFCAFNLASYAQTCVTVGKYGEAADLARRGLAFSQAFGDRIGTASCQLALGMALAAQGQWAVAAAYLQHSLALGRQSGHRFLHVYSAVHLGRVLLARDDTAAAQLQFEEALDAATRNGGVPYMHLATVLNSLGMAAGARGERHLAARYHQQALKQAPGCPAWEVQDAWFGLAQVSLARGELAQAGTIFERVAQAPATAAATRTAADRHLRQLAALARAVSPP